jgi:hypothetical protein
VVYALLLSVAILAGVDVWLLHGRLIGAVAVRLAQLPAIRRVVQFRTARVACCETNCRLLAEVDGLSATPPDSNGLAIEIGRIRACNSDARIENLTLRDAAGNGLVTAAGATLGLAVPLAARIDGIALGSSPPLATVGSVDLHATLGDKQIAIDRTSANNIRAADDLLVIPSVSLSPTSVPRSPDPEIVVPLITVGGASSRLERRSDGSWKLPDAARVQALASPLQQAYTSLLANYAKIAPAVRAFAFWLVVVVTVIVIAAKLALTPASLWRRVISAAIAAGAGYLLYSLAVRNPLVYLAAGAAIAAALAIAIYGKSPNWYQRIEPAFADLVSPVSIGLALMLHAFVLAPLPGQPRRVTIARVQVGPTSAAVLASGLGNVTADIAGVDVDRIRLDLSLPGIQIDRVQANTASVATSPDALRSTVPQIVAEGIRVAKGSPPVGTVSLRGVAQSPLLVEQLRKFSFLPDAIRRPGNILHDLEPWRRAAFGMSGDRRARLARLCRPRGPHSHPLRRGHHGSRLRRCHRLERRGRHRRRPPHSPPLSARVIRADRRRQWTVQLESWNSWPNRSGARRGFRLPYRYAGVPYRHRKPAAIHRARRRAADSR